MHHERNVIGLGACSNVNVQRARPSQCKETCLSLTPGLQFYDLETVRLRHGTRWGMHASLDHERLDTPLPQVPIEFVGRIGRIEWHAYRARGHRETRPGHFPTLPA